MYNVSVLLIQEYIENPEERDDQWSVNKENIIKRLKLICL